jgi:YihY family inner membrane protein
MRLALERSARRAWTVAHLAATRFVRIDGTQWAGAFAFNAFLSLFPLIILFVTLGSFFVDRESAGREIVAYIDGYVPLDGETRARIFGAIADVIHARERAGLVALLLLVWPALQCFTTLISVTNRAWGGESYNWWRLPLRGMSLLGVTGGAVLVGMAAPALAGAAKSWLFPARGVGAWIYALWGYVIPLLVLFLSLSLFYRLAPRRPTRFADVWVAAASTTVLLQLTERLFVVYLEYFPTLTAVYGVFGGIVALLLWIYLSGCGFIYGACLCAAHAQVRTEALQPC